LTADYQEPEQNRRCFALDGCFVDNAIPVSWPSDRI